MAELKIKHKKNAVEREVELKNMRTRFHVEMVKNSGEGSAEELSHLYPDNDGDTEEVKNFKYLTREALPRLDNYRHIMSIHAAYRPTLDDLHNALTTKGSESHYENVHQCQSYNTGSMIPAQYGWIRGVFIPNILSICGAALFLRFTWITVQTRLIESLVLIVFAGVVNLITALSISAISTNGITKEGGSYTMMSRSLGPEFGVPVGIMLLVSNIGLCAMYITGLVEYVVYATSACLLDCGSVDNRGFSTLLFVMFLLITVLCHRWSNTLLLSMKVQIPLLALIVAAVVDFVFSVVAGYSSNAQKVSFSSFKLSVLQENLYSVYPNEANVEFSLFFSFFGIFYPFVSEFLTGVTMSGCLKDPLKSIPKGTISSVVVSSAFYVIIAILVSGTVSAGGVTIQNLNNQSVGDMVPVCYNNTCSNMEEYSLYFLVEHISKEKNLVKIATISTVVYCVFVNCVTAVTSFRVLCMDALYPKLFRFNAKITKPLQAYIFTAVITVLFILPGKLNYIAPVVSILLLAAYALINFCTFHVSLIHPVGWRPTFKSYNMWLSLAASVLCVILMFLISWIAALLTAIAILTIYLAVSYQKPSNLNWGSSTQAQTYISALLSVHTLSRVEDHVKNYRPQVLVLSGLPSNRPPLMSFANLITKNVSLLICGHIHTDVVSYKDQLQYSIKAQSWLDFHKIKAFYTQVDDVTFENGAKSLMQASGLGKLKPNILLMGYKSDWTNSSKNDLEMYFNIIHKALDSYLALCILRVSNGLDFSSLVVDQEQLKREQNTHNNSVTNVVSLSETKKPVAEHKRVMFLKAETRVLPMSQGKSNLLEEQIIEYEDLTISDIYKNKNGLGLSTDMINRVTQFQGKQKKGTIDVWWLYDDGGLTLLLPYIISTRRNWSSCKLRVFALASNYDPLDFEQRNMASLLSKFRIDYSDLTVFSDLTKKPQEETIAFYETLIKDFVSASKLYQTEEKIIITESDLNTMTEKTNRHLRLRELLLEHSQDANLIVMTLPIPRKSVVSAALYMSWLEALTQGMPPFLLVRGNQTSVLTFYS